MFVFLYLAKLTSFRRLTNSRVTTCLTHFYANNLRSVLIESIYGQVSSQ